MAARTLGLSSESGRGGWKTQGGGKTYRKFGEKPLPKSVFGPPHLRYVFPPPLCWRLSVISLKRKRHRPDQPQFLRPPKVVLESTLCSTFPPPPNSRDTFCPPSAAAQLVAPYCAIPRDYLSDTPLLRAMGFWCLNMANWVRYPLPFSERFPLGEHAKCRCDTPPQKRYLQRYLRDTL